jgi:hypothetical protein
MMIDRILNRQELTNQRNYRADFTAPQQAFVQSEKMAMKAGAERAS